MIRKFALLLATCAKTLNSPFSSYLLIACACSFFSAAAPAVDSQYPELVMTGKQSNYAGAWAAQTKRSASKSNKKNLDAGLLGHQLNKHSTLVVPTRETSQGQSDGSSKPDTSNVGYTTLATTEQVTAGSVISPLQDVRSPVRLRKHLAIRSSKSQFLRMCTVNDCFSRNGQQNFLIR